LRQFKESHGIGYEQMAREIGVSFMSVYRWLKRGVLPRNRLVIKAVDEFLEQNGYPSEREEVRRIRADQIVARR